MEEKDENEVCLMLAKDGHLLHSVWFSNHSLSPSETSLMRGSDDEMA